MLTNVCDNSVEVILCADSLVRARGFIRPWRQLSPRRQLRFQRRPARLCRCRVSLLNLGHVSLSGRHCYALLSQTLEWQGSGVVSPGAAPFTVIASCRCTPDMARRCLSSLHFGEVANHRYIFHAVPGNGA